MRGAERPGKVQWTHPFLRPLLPLSNAAARQTFIEIADEIHGESEVDQLLEITDNIPLAVQLVATVAASEGCQATLEQWKFEKTTLLSAGYDKHSNLEISIMLSLSSPRMQASPHATELLSLMSLLSDGISDIDLAQSKSPIPDILKSKTALIRTSLAYVDRTGRLKVLAPIREYIQIARPPSSNLVRPLQKHLTNLLKMWNTAFDCSPLAADSTPNLMANLGNLHNLLLHGLQCDPGELREIVQGIISLNRLNMLMNRGLTPLMLYLPEKLPQTNDHRLQGLYITERFRSRLLYGITNPDKDMAEAIEHFHIIKDVEGEGKYYSRLREIYSDLYLCLQLNFTVQLQNIISTVSEIKKGHRIFMSMHCPWHHNVILPWRKCEDCWAWLDSKIFAEIRKKL